MRSHANTILSIRLGAGELIVWRRKNLSLIYSQDLSRYSDQVDKECQSQPWLGWKKPVYPWKMKVKVSRWGRSRQRYITMCSLLKPSCRLSTFASALGHILGDCKTCSATDCGWLPHSSSDSTSTAIYVAYWILILTYVTCAWHHAENNWHVLTSCSTDSWLIFPSIMRLMTLMIPMKQLWWVSLFGACDAILRTRGSLTNQLQENCWNLLYPWTNIWARCVFHQTTLCVPLCSKLLNCWCHLISSRHVSNHCINC